jgi:hypothetical protein
MKNNLQSYMKNASKEYVFDVAMDESVDAPVLEKRLVGFGLSKLVGYKTEPGHFKITLGYPIAGKDLLARLCENSIKPVKISDESGQVYSNYPLPAKAAEEVKEVELTESVETPVELAPVIELKKPAPVKEARFDSFAVAAIVTESLSKNLESLVTNLLEEKSIKSAETIAEIAATMTESIAELRASIAEISNEVAQISMNLNEAMDSYNRKIVELAESSNRLNHKVVKHVKRDANGFIVEVTEQITPER